jgi:acyl-CoA-binding protein
MTCTVPELALARPARMLMSVVLPAPLGAQQAEELARLDVEAHALEGLEFALGGAEGLGDPRKTQGRHATCAGLIVNCHLLIQRSFKLPLIAVRFKTAFRLTSHLRSPSMSDLKAAFDQAVADSKNLPERPDNMTLLKIYALFKQGSQGDVEGERPGFTDFVARAKYDAWAELKGQTLEQAQQAYVDLIESLK